MSYESFVVIAVYEALDGCLTIEHSGMWECESLKKRDEFIFNFVARTVETAGHDDIAFEVRDLPNRA